MKRRIMLLGLALVIALAIVVAGCTQKDDKASLPPASESQADQGEFHEGYDNPAIKTEEDSGPVDPGGVADVKDKKLASYTLDVACMPKSAAGKAGTNQPDGSTPPPEEMPPAPVVPSLDDSVQFEEMEGTKTNRDVLEGIEGTGSEASKDSEAKEKFQKAKDTGKIPVCEEDGNYKGEDPGHSKSGSTDVDPEMQSKAAQILDQIKTKLDPKVKQADAQSSCQPIAIVQAGTTASAGELQSLASSIDSQLWNDFSPNWWCGYAYYASSPFAVGTGSWPIYMCGGNGCTSGSQAGSWHSWGYWPFYPYTYAPYGQVTDNSTSYSSSNPETWGVAASHEAIEALSNPYVRDYTTGWWTTATIHHILPNSNGDADYQWEAADPVYENSKGYNRTSGYDSRVWKVSNFVNRYWFTEGHAGPWDMTSSLGGTSYTVGPFEAKCYGYILANTPTLSSNRSAWGWPFHCP